MANIVAYNISYTLKHKPVLVWRCRPSSEILFFSVHSVSHEQLQKLRIRRNILKKTSKKMRFQLFESLLEFQGIYLKLFFFWHVWLCLLLALKLIFLSGVFSSIGL